MAGEYPAGCVEVEGFDKYLSGKRIVLASPLAAGLWMAGSCCRADRKKPEINSNCPNWRRFILDEDEDENGIKAIESVGAVNSIEAIEQS